MHKPSHVTSSAVICYLWQVLGAVHFKPQSSSREEYRCMERVKRVNTSSVCPRPSLGVSIKPELHLYTARMKLSARLPKVVQERYIRLWTPHKERTCILPCRTGVLVDASSASCYFPTPYARSTSETQSAPFTAQTYLGLRIDRSRRLG